MKKNKIKLIPSDFKRRGEIGNINMAEVPVPDHQAYFRIGEKGRLKMILGF